MSTEFMCKSRVKALTDSASTTDYNDRLQAILKQGDTTGHGPGGEPIPHEPQPGSPEIPDFPGPGEPDGE